MNKRESVKYHSLFLFGKEKDMGANNRTCLCCGKSFRFCPNCGKRNDGYNINFDTKECAELFNAVSGYNMGTINANGVNKILIKYDIKDFGKYKESIANLLRQLFPNMSKSEVKKQVEKTEEVLAVTTEEKESANPNNSFKNRFSKKNKSYQTKEVELSDETTDKEVKANTGISEDE